MWTPDLQAFNHAATEQQRIAARDLFALGCYLESVGTGVTGDKARDAGAKARWAALEGIGVPISSIHELVNHIQTDRAWIAANVAPHAEILSLFEDLR